MSKSIKIFLLASTLVLLLSVGIVMAEDTDSETFNSTVAKYFNKDDKEIQSSLMALSKEQLIKEINILAGEMEEKGNIESLIPFAKVLLERKNELNNMEIIDMISDTTNPIITREIMVDLYSIKNENNSDQNEIKKLLRVQNIDNRIKTRIVSSTPFDKNDVNLLKDLISEDQGILAFHSLKKLSKINDEEAYEISNKILSNYKSETNEKISAALKSTAQYLRNNKSNIKDYLDLEKNYIDSSFNIMNNTGDKFLKDSAFFSVSDLMSKEAIKSIIKNETINKEHKVLAVDQNFFALKEILNNNPSKEDIEIVVEAMELLPITDLVEDLEKVIDDVSDADLQQRALKVLEYMKLSGIKANQKWLDEVK